jgi:3-oxocholest-4-en-26-oate---CoA ligase
MATFNFGDLYDLAAATVPDKVAIRYDGTSITFAESAARTDRIASALHAAGVRRGDTVALHLHNVPAHIEAYLAACKLGAAPVNVNYRYQAEELEYLYANMGIAALYVGAEFLEVALPVARRQSTLKVVVAVDAPSGSLPAGVLDHAAIAADISLPPPPAERRSDDLVVLYTGGTTGMPKGVVWTQEDLLFSALGGAGYYSPLGPIKVPEDLPERIRSGYPLTCLSLPPLMHAAAMWYCLVGLFAGQTAVLNPARHFDAEQVLDLIVAESVHSIIIVGDAMARPLAEALEAHPGRWNLSRLAMIGSGGAPLSAHLQARLAAQLPNTRVMTSLGTSESGALGPGAPSPDGMLRLQPRPDLTILVRSGAGEAAHWRRAVTGERGIISRCGRLPRGYLGDPVKTAATFTEVDGVRFAVTGDEGRLEDDGGITLFGRGSTSINTGGEKVHPEEVEEVLRRHPAVLDAIVVGVPDPRWGEAVTALVQVREGTDLDAEALRAHCRGALAGYKVPKHLLLVPVVPRSPAGKADYPWGKRTARELLGLAPT